MMMGLEAHAARMLAALPVCSARTFARRHPRPQPIVALDVGDRRVGVAFCDDEQIAAFPAGIVERGGKAFPGASAAFARLHEEHPAKGLVVGYPLHMDGSTSEQCLLTLDFLVWLKRVWPYQSILLWDERLSTVGARGSRPSRRGQQQHVDHHVAVDLLDQYLGGLR